MDPKNVKSSGGFYYLFMKDYTDRRCVIIGGAPLKDREYAKGMIRRDDFFVFCDGGLKNLEWVKEITGRDPDLIVGDFDSAKDPGLDSETITLPVEKDDTDTFFAVKECIKRGFEKFLLMGVFGGRLDHSLGNVSALLYLFLEGKYAVAIDDYIEAEIVGKETKTVEGSYPFFSLINIGGDPRGINIKNAKYPLVNARILPEFQYGISNQVLPGLTSEINVEEGYLLLVKVRKDA